LHGTGFVAGVALGRAETLPSFDAIAAYAGDATDVAQLAGAFESVTAELAKALRRAEAPRASSPLTMALPLMLSDQRFRGCAETECRARGLVEGLREVA